jgi:hypothetical protein
MLQDKNKADVTWTIDVFSMSEPAGCLTKSNAGKSRRAISSRFLSQYNPIATGTARLSIILTLPTYFTKFAPDFPKYFVARKNQVTFDSDTM